MTPRVAFVLPDLNGGGAERAVLELANTSRLDCTILTERSGGQFASHRLAADVECLNVSPGRVGRAIGLARGIHERRIEVLVSGLSPVVVVAAGQMQGIPVINWIQNPLSEVLQLVPGSRRPRLRTGAARLIATGSAAIAVTAPGLRDEWRRAGVPDERTCVLPNGTRLPGQPSEQHRVATDELQILSVGRLVPQKRHDVAITALAVLRASGWSAHLEILGVGPHESALRAHAARLDMAAHVTFSGFLSDPSARYRAADVFVLTSDFEGFGNVLVEALAHELPIVATDAPYGPRFILEGLRGTRLVALGAAEAVAQEIREVVSERRADPSLGAAARARAEAFSVERVASHFDAIVEAVVAHSGLPQWV